MNPASLGIRDKIKVIFYKNNSTYNFPCNKNQFLCDYDLGTNIICIQIFEEKYFPVSGTYSAILLVWSPVCTPHFSSHFAVQHFYVADDLQISLNIIPLQTIRAESRPQNYLSSFIIVIIMFTFTLKVFNPLHSSST